MNPETYLVPVTPLLDGTAPEQLAYFEHKILAGINVEREIGQALCEIKARRLFKIYHLSFSDYCKARFNYGRSRCYQLVAFGGACATAAAAGEPPPANERAFREARMRRAGKGSGLAEQTRLQKILRDAVMAQPPDERIELIQALQLFLGRLAKDLVANRICSPPIPAAPTPATPLQAPTPPVAMAENSIPAARTNVSLAVTAATTSQADKATNPPPAAELKMATPSQNSQSPGALRPLIRAWARQHGFVDKQ